MRWDMQRANEHAAMRRMVGDAGYSGGWQWLRSLFPRWDWR